MSMEAIIGLSGFSRSTVKRSIDTLIHARLSPKRGEHDTSMVSLPSAFRLLPIPAFVKEKPQAAIKLRAQRGRISAKRRFQVLRKCVFRCVY